MHVCIYIYIYIYTHVCTHYLLCDNGGPTVRLAPLGCLSPSAIAG